MLLRIAGTLKGIFFFFLTLLSTLLFSILLIPTAIIKFIFPVQAVRKMCDYILNWICTSWANFNNFNISFFLNTKWEITKSADLSLKKWYLVISNHQSWVDILVLQYVFNGKIPYFRFFLKDQLKWFPILNIAWWALDYPFMKRYSKRYLEENPHLKGKDIEAAKRACKKFMHVPVSIMNFVEGTRFKQEKKEKTKSPYKHLLIPNAGGIALAIDILKEKLDSIIDVTIVYPEGCREIWDFICGKIPKIKVDISAIKLTEDIKGNYFNDNNFKEYFKGWLNNIWKDKDLRISRMLQKAD